MHFPPSPPIPTVSPLTLLSLQPLLCVSQWILHGAAGGWWLPSLARSLVAESSHFSSESKRNEQYTHSPFLTTTPYMYLWSYICLHISHTHTHTSRKFHIHSWHCCPQKSCFHSNKSLLLQVPYLWAPSHKLCSSQSEQTEQRTDPVINHTSFDLASYHLSVVLHVAITITWPSHDYHITITWLSHDYHMTVHNYHMTITWLSHDYHLTIMCMYV